MSWLACRSPGDGARQTGRPSRPGPLLTGSLLGEIDLGGLSGETMLLRARNRQDLVWALALDLTAEGRLRLRLRLGEDRLRLSLQLSPEDMAAPLRLTFSWDMAAEAPGGTRQPRSLLTLENLRNGTLRQAEIALVLALPRNAAEALFVSPRSQRHPALGWFALADHLHCPGPCPGLAPGTLIETPQGPRAIETLAPGEQVLTVEGDAVPLVWAGAVELPAQGSFRPLRLRAPYYGRQRDLFATPGQRLLFAGTETEYLVGHEEVLVEARHLENGLTALPEAGPPVRRWHGLLCERHELILAEGCAVESLFAGRLARRPEIAATTLFAALAARGALPMHLRPARPELKQYEAQGLQARRMRAQAPLAA